jgi:catechol 2,3-dioxygenase-like lactoylglutathione lyase family enzyme
LQKTNLHEVGAEFDPHAADPAPGSGDFCLLTETPIAEVGTRLRELGIDVLRGPVERTGARGVLESVYVRDPDGNLVEIARYR